MTKFQKLVDDVMATHGYTREQAFCFIASFLSNYATEEQIKFMLS
jgi:hypothetical protein